MKIEDMISKDVLSRYVVEYSESQNSFHISKIDDMLGMNIQSLFEKRFSGFILIGISDTYDQAFEFMQKVQNKLKDLNK